MLYHLLASFRYEISAFNVVRYITFRTAVASLTALFLVLVLGPWRVYARIVRVDSLSLAAQEWRRVWRAVGD